MIFMRALCTVILAIGYTTATGYETDSHLDLKNSDPQSIISARASSLIDFYNENSSEGLPLCRRLDRKTAVKHYGKGQYRAVAVLLNGCEILNTDNPQMTKMALGSRRRELRTSFKALLVCKPDDNEYQELAKEIIGRVANNFNEAIQPSDCSAVFKWAYNHFISKIRPLSIEDVTIDSDDILGKSEDEYLSALDEKLKNSPNGFPFCDESIYSYGRAKFYRFIRPVAIVLFLCEPTTFQPYQVAGSQPTLEARCFGLKQAISDLLNANHLNRFEQKAKNVIERLSEIIDAPEAGTETRINEFVHMIRPSMDKGPLSTISYVRTAAVPDESVAITIETRDTGKRKGSPITKSSLEGKRKQTRTNAGINAETLSVSEDLVGKQAVPESVSSQNKGKGPSNVNSGLGYTWRMSVPQSNFGFSISPPNNPSTQQYPHEPIRNRPQGMQVHTLTLGNLPASAGQVLRPTASRPNSGRTRFTIASIFGSHAESSSEEEKQNPET